MSLKERLRYLSTKTGIWLVILLVFLATIVYDLVNSSRPEWYQVLMAIAALAMIVETERKKQAGKEPE